MAIDLWDTLTLLTAVGIYAAVAGVVGGLFALLVFLRASPTKPVWRYLRWSCVLGLVASTLHFFVRTMALADSFGGAFDTTLISIVGNSGLGEAARLQAGGFTAVWLGSFVTQQAVRWLQQLGMAGLGLGVLALLCSFPLAGHLAEEDWPTRLALALHVFAMSLWIGSFYPLLHLIRSSTRDLAGDKLKSFSRLANLFVALLVVCGVWLSLVLIPNVGALVADVHGRVLTIKLGLVGLLLLLAAANRWVWVPRLSEPTVPAKLLTSIRSELALGVGVLILTGVLANLVGPHH